MSIVNRRTITASGDFRIQPAGDSVGAGGWLVTVVGASWTGSLVFKQNQAPPGANANLVTIPYTNPDTGVITTAGTAITSSTAFIVTLPYTGNNLDVSYTHTAGSVQITVEPNANVTVSGGITLPAADVSSGTFGANIPDTGAYGFAGVLNVTGNFNIATNKFQVVATSGNTTVAGTLGVTGIATITGGASVGAALATSATAGYFSIPTVAGTPTGVPAGLATGTCAIHYDTTANKIWVYNGSWRGILVA